METTATTNLTHCPNCGAEIKDTLVDTLKVCEYCGAKLYTNTGQADTQPTLIGKLNITRDNISQSIARYLDNPDIGHPNILLDDIVLSDARLYYYPAFLFKGKYTGAWRVRPHSSAPTPQGKLDEDFSILSFAATKNSICESADQKKISNTLQWSMADVDDPSINPEYISKLIEISVKYSLTDDNVAPFNQQDKLPDGIQIEFGMDEQNAWTIHGKQQLNAEVERHSRYKAEDYNVNDPNTTQFDMHYDVKFTQKVRLFVPVWEVTMHYDNHPYFIAVSGIDGSALGDMIDESLKISVRIKQKNSSKLISGWILFGVWFAWGLARILLGERSPVFAKSDHFNNILISPIFEWWWWPRAAIMAFLCTFGAAAFEMPLRSRLEVKSAGDKLTRFRTANQPYLNGTKSFKFK